MTYRYVILTKKRVLQYFIYLYYESGSIPTTIVRFAPERSYLNEFTVVTVLFIISTLFFCIKKQSIDAKNIDPIYLSALLV